MAPSPPICLYSARCLIRHWHMAYARPTTIMNRTPHVRARAMVGPLSSWSGSLARCCRMAWNPTSGRRLSAWLRDGMAATDMEPEGRTELFDV